jgi:uncharacterized protein YeaO (DUF488 family)
MIKISRAQIGKCRERNKLDITVANASGWAKLFAPTWDMVHNVKEGRITEKQYTAQYREILDALPVKAYRTLYRFGYTLKGITFVCFCRDDQFCHTHLLIDYLVDHPKYGKGFER